MAFGSCSVQVLSVFYYTLNLYQGLQGDTDIAANYFACYLTFEALLIRSYAYRETSLVIALKHNLCLLRLGILSLYHLVGN